VPPPAHRGKERCGCGKREGERAGLRGTKPVFPLIVGKKGDLENERGGDLVRSSRKKNLPSSRKKPCCRNESDEKRGLLPTFGERGDLSRRGGGGAGPSNKKKENFWPNTLLSELSIKRVLQHLKRKGTLVGERGGEKEVCADQKKCSRDEAWGEGRDATSAQKEKEISCFGRCKEITFWPIGGGAPPFHHLPHPRPMHRRRGKANVGKNS